MFEVDMKECDGGSVTLSYLSPQAVHSFLDFAYLGQMEIMEENIDMLFHLAAFLQVTHYKEESQSIVWKSIFRAIVHVIIHSHSASL